MSDAATNEGEREGAKVRGSREVKIDFSLVLPSRPSSPLRAFAFASFLLLAATTGCHDIGRGGTGEMVVPPRELRQIGSTTPDDFGRVSPIPPTTLPST